MPPPDTTYIPRQTGPPPPIGDPYMDSVIQQAWSIQKTDIYQDDSFFNTADVLFVIFLGLLIYFSLKEKRVINSLKRMNRGGRLKSVNYLLLNKKQQYHEWLSKYNAYYSLLSPVFQQRFLQRVATFIKAKKFRYHSLQEEEIMPVLISGAAVQMTFGLSNYLMDYFSVIHVIKKEYVLTMDKETYYGHVSRNGIYISWDHFLKGYEDYEDSMNVGLHEMAHAISYDIFLGQQDKHDHLFKKRLDGFAIKGKPVFQAMRREGHDVLDEYGTTNFDEFWAVCIETFFENADEFRKEAPELYFSIVELLNQDTLNSGIIINKEVAGL